MLDTIQITWVSLFPSILTIACAFITRQVLLSLFLGIIAGGISLSLQTNDINNLNIVQQFLLPSIGNKTYATVLLIYLWCLGGIIGLWAKTGSANFFAEHLGKKIAKGPRSSLLFTWALGMIFHQGGTISTILTGTTAKPIADYYKVSHEELSYVVDSTAAPVATLIPFNAWPLIIGGVIIGTVPFIENSADAYKIYLSSLPLNFYAIFAVTMTLFFSLDWLPWIGKKMCQAKTRAREQGQLDSPTAEPMIQTNEHKIEQAAGYIPSLFGFLIPIAILLSLTIIPFSLWKLDIVNEKHANWINEAFLLSTLSAIIVAKLRGMKTNDILEGFMSGCKEMTIGALILALAFTMGTVAKELHTADYLINLLISDVSTQHPPTLLVVLLPAALMGLCMVVAFSTGTSLGTYAVVLPLALPLAYSINPEILYIQVCFGAVMGGAVFGDQCSPISDTTILSSMFTGCDIMDHVRTQLPMALIAATAAGICSTLVVIFNT